MTSVGANDQSTMLCMLLMWCQTMETHVDDDDLLEITLSYDLNQ